jgi:hypothetical protein
MKNMKKALRQSLLLKNSNKHISLTPLTITLSHQNSFISIKKDRGHKKTAALPYRQSRGNYPLAYIFMPHAKNRQLPLFFTAAAPAAV